MPCHWCCMLSHPDCKGKEPACGTLECNENKQAYCMQQEYCMQHDIAPAVEVRHACAPGDCSEPCPASQEQVPVSMLQCCLNSRAHWR